MNDDSFFYNIKEKSHYGSPKQAELLELTLR